MDKVICLLERSPENTMGYNNWGCAIRVDLFRRAVIIAIGGNLGKRKVLLVDDDVELVELMTKVLEEDGRFEVRVATTGFDAGMMVKEYRPDLIVLDVMLPDINGKEVCHRVRADPSLEDVRILCISGMIEDDKIQELKLSGADDFLHKPFDIEELIDRMCAQLEIEPVSQTA